MVRRTLLLSIAIVLGLGALTACALLSPDASFAAVHPQQLEKGRPLCSECHSAEQSKGALKPYASFDHTPTFVKDHRMQAGSEGNTCATCHAPSFCSDCHGGKTMMKPSVKMGDRPDRAFQHRGDYLTQHRMEGKIDPTGCYKCHGRANNDKCRACHK